MHDSDHPRTWGRWPDPFYALGVLVIGLNLVIGNGRDRLAIVLVLIWTAGMFIARFGYRRRHVPARSLFALVGYAAVFVALVMLHMPFDSMMPFIFFIPALCAYAMPELLEVIVVAGTLTGLCITYRVEIGLSQVVNFGFGVISTTAIWMMVFRLMLNLETERNRYYRLSTTDGMTGLLTLGRALELGQGMLSRGESVSLAIIDLDGFKQINDTYGHLAGNRVLTEFSYRLSAAAANLSPDSVIGRLGGDEFVIVVPSASSEDTFDELADSLAHETYRPAPQVMPRPLPFSLGCAVAPDESRKSIEELMHEADLSMYAHKRQAAEERRSGLAEVAATDHLLS